MGSHAWSGRHYRQVDVFSDGPLGGNGLSVFWESRGLSAGDMQALTIELRQFESTFLEAADAKNRFRARVFTAEEELDFAGHPILGASAVLHEKLGTGVSESWTMQMRTSTFMVRTERQGSRFKATMYQPPPVFGPSAIDEQSAFEIAHALNLERSDLRPDLPLEVISTGLPYLIVPVQSNIAKARVMDGSFEALLKEHGAKFVYLYDVDHAEGRTWDNRGQVEDIATGSAAGPVAAYLCRHGRLTVGKELVISQGRYVNRPSLMRARVLAAGRDLGEVEVTGLVHMVAEGVLD